MQIRKKKFLIIICIIGVLLLIGIPGRFKPSSSFFNKATQETTPLQVLRSEDQQLKVNISNFPKNAVPVFGLFTSTILAQKLGSYIDFGTLSELKDINLIFANQILTDETGVKYKVLRKKSSKTLADKSLTISSNGNLALVSDKVISEKKKIRSNFLTPIVTNLGIFNEANCYEKLKPKDLFASKCSGVIYNSPYQIEYFQSEQALEVYYLPTHEPFWTQLNLYSESVLSPFGRLKLSKAATKNIKAKVQLSNRDFSSAKEVYIGTVSISNNLNLPSEHNPIQNISPPPTVTASTSQELAPEISISDQTSESATPSLSESPVESTTETHSADIPPPEVEETHAYETTAPPIENSTVANFDETQTILFPSASPEIIAISPPLILSSPPNFIIPIAGKCGDREVNLDLGESCDDGNQINGDGCSSTCRRENSTIQINPPSVLQPSLNPGWQPSFNPSLQPSITIPIYGPIAPRPSQTSIIIQNPNCANRDPNFVGPLQHWCGDGVIDSPCETCDDRNNINNDGCSASCVIETTSGTPSTTPVIITTPSQTPIAPISEDCNNQIDDDLDNLTDCDDLDCKYFEHCKIIVDVNKNAELLSLDPEFIINFGNKIEINPGGVGYASLSNGQDTLSVYSNGDVALLDEKSIKIRFATYNQGFSRYLLPNSQYNLEIRGLVVINDPEKGLRTFNLTKDGGFKFSTPATSSQDKFYIHKIAVTEDSDSGGGGVSPSPSPNDSGSPSPSSSESPSASPSPSPSDGFGMACGNGTLDNGEECDDGNKQDGDGCDSHCKTNCGDGIKAGSEECDDGNTVDNDGCSNECKADDCGNSVIDENEQCDEGAQNGMDGACCDFDCFPPGNGVCFQGQPLCVLGCKADTNKGEKSCQADKDCGNCEKDLDCDFAECCKNFSCSTDCEEPSQEPSQEPSVEPSPSPSPECITNDDCITGSCCYNNLCSECTATPSPSPSVPGGGSAVCLNKAVETGEDCDFEDQAQNDKFCKDVHNVNFSCVNCKCVEVTPSPSPSASPSPTPLCEDPDEIDIYTGTSVILRTYEETKYLPDQCDGRFAVNERICVSPDLAISTIEKFKCPDKYCCVGTEGHCVIGDDVCPRCGNGKVDDFEDCDDQNDNHDDFCGNDCKFRDACMCQYESDGCKSDVESFKATCEKFYLSDKCKNAVKLGPQGLDLKQFNALQQTVCTKPPTEPANPGYRNFYYAYAGHTNPKWGPACLKVALNVCISNSGQVPTSSLNLVSIGCHWLADRKTFQTYADEIIAANPHLTIEAIGPTSYGYDLLPGGTIPGEPDPGNKKCVPMAQGKIDIKGSKWKDPPCEDVVGRPCSYSYSYGNNFGQCLRTNKGPAYVENVKCCALVHPPKDGKPGGSVDGIYKYPEDACPPITRESHFECGVERQRCILVEGAGSNQDGCSEYDVACSVPTRLVCNEKDGKASCTKVRSENGDSNDEGCTTEGQACELGGEIPF